MEIFENNINTDDASGDSKTYNTGKYYDNVLLKLKRVYSKDETVSALSKKLSEVEIELGKSIAYIHELEDTIKEYKLSKNRDTLYFKKYNDLKIKYDFFNREVKLDELYKSKQKEIKKLQEDLKRLRKSNSELVSKICVLESKKN